MNLTLTRPAATLSHRMGEGLGVRALFGDSMREALPGRILSWTLNPLLAFFMMLTSSTPPAARFLGDLPITPRPIAWRANSSPVPCVPSVQWGPQAEVLLRRSRRKRYLHPALVRSYCFRSW